MGKRFHKFTNKQISWLRENNVFTAAEVTPLFNATFDVELTKGQIINARDRNNIKTVRTGSENESRFKKGVKPQNVKQIGAEVLRTNGYVYVKVGHPGKWRQIIHVEWERLNGPLPQGKMVRSIDNNRFNFDPDNLVVISRYENLILTISKFNRVSKELQLTALGICRLRAIVHDKTKG